MKKIWPSSQEEKFQKWNDGDMTTSFLTRVKDNNGRYISVSFKSTKISKVEIKWGINNDMCKEYDLIVLDSEGVGHWNAKSEWELIPLLRYSQCGKILIMSPQDIFVITTNFRNN